MKLLTEGDYADFQIKREKEESYRCYDCGELYTGQPVRVITDSHGDETPFCSECWEEYKATIFANKFGF